MNILILHNSQDLRDDLPQAEPLKASISIRDVSGANLAQAIAQASMVAIAGPADLASATWAAVLAQVRQLELPTVSLGLAHEAIDTSCLSGACGVSQNPNGTLEVRCAAQQEALTRMNALIGGGGQLGLRSAKRSRGTRFNFDGD